MLHFIKDFLKLEAASGLVLMATALLAMLAANSALAPHYGAFVSASHLAINDGLMAIFFLLVGMEIKRELSEGELSTRDKAILPLVAACGGVALPALIYSVMNWGTPAIDGWAIPSATDIAFSLGVLALFGDRLNTSLKIFLMAVAVIDDLIAVIIIALFYTAQLHLASLAVVLACALLLWAMNRKGVMRLMPYLIVGVVMWAAMLKSGVHATIAGVLLGFLIPTTPADASKASPCERLIHALHPWVAFCIVPLFAFANAGVPLAGMTFSQVLHPVPLGIILGLFAGKQLGIFSIAWLMVRLGLAKLPEGASWTEFYAVCVLAGIGFTMSLFIGALAFADVDAQTHVRLGVLIGSLLSAVFGYSLLALALRRARRSNA